MIDRLELVGVELPNARQDIVPIDHVRGRIEWNHKSRDRSSERLCRVRDLLLGQREHVEVVERLVQTMLMKLLERFLYLTARSVGGHLKRDPGRCAAEVYGRE